MNNIPRIEVHTSSAQQPLQQPPSSAYIPYRPEYLPAPSTVFHEIGTSNNHEQQQPSIPKDPLRSTFWSRLRRSKSEKAIVRKGASNKTSQSAQPAQRGVNLVWCQERKIWLFPLEEEAAPVVNSSAQASKKKRRPISANFLPLPSSWRRRDEVDEERMLSAQLPGHYSLNIYDYHGNTLLQRSTEDLGMSGSFSMPTPVSRPTTAPALDEPHELERGWMSVASRMTRQPN